MKRRYRTFLNLILGLLTILLWYLQLQLPSSDNTLGVSQTPTPTFVHTAPVYTDTVLVTRIIDGDTIEIEGGKHVRYIGIDTPETVAPRKAVQCFGKEASEANKLLILGKKVRLEKDISETDGFGRLLRYVYIGKIMVNDSMVRNGFARAISYPPDIKYQERLLAAEREARENNRGLWSGCPLSSTP